MSLGGITTGPATSIKQSAKDASKLAKAEEQKAKEEADRQIAAKAEGVVCYTKRGVPVFNCISIRTGKKIAFAGGRFFVTQDNPDREEIIETLDHFVRRGLLEKTE